jgi:hypothetical protein
MWKMPPAKRLSMALSSSVAAKAAVAPLLWRLERNTHQAIVAQVVTNSITLSNQGHQVFPLSLLSCKQIPRSDTTSQTPCSHTPPLSMDPPAQERHWPAWEPVQEVQFAKHASQVADASCQKVDAGQTPVHRPDVWSKTGNAGGHVTHWPQREHVAQSAGHDWHRRSAVERKVPSGHELTQFPAGVAYFVESAQTVHCVGEVAH